MRYPFAPVDVQLGATEPSVLADKLGVVPDTIRKWRERGLTEENADRVATALGLHPWQLWPEMLAAATAPVERECETCGETFVLTRSDKRFCNPSCGKKNPARVEQWRAAKNERYRARYATDDEWREARLAKRRTDYATSTGPAERAKQRIRDKRKRAA